MADPAHRYNVLVLPYHPEADAGYVVLNRMEYSMMSGGDTVSVTTVPHEMGILPMVEPFADLVPEAPPA